ncbi:Thiamine transporter protein (Thia_YuaJ) [Ruminococcaceae bacterium YRB3002]|nr:Thiamine transporter protein (Thia_YuaJ) [Ruminococcaceae bacterium YRB3002]
MMNNKQPDFKLGKYERCWGKKHFWIPLLFIISIFFSLLQPVRLGEGGEVTLMSMLFIFLIAYCYGGVIGTLSSCLFGIVRFCIDYYIMDYIDRNNLLAENNDYFYGYLVMGLAGFFVTLAYRVFKEKMEEDPERKEEIEGRILVIGYTIASLLHYLEGVYNCYHYYEPQMGTWERLVHSLKYAFGYIGVEAIITIILLLTIPKLREAIVFVRKMAREPYDPNLDIF